MTKCETHQKMVIGKIMSIGDANQILNMLLEFLSDVFIIDPLLLSVLHNLDFIRVVEPQLSENLLSVQSSEMTKFDRLAGPRACFSNWDNWRGR